LGQAAYSVFEELDEPRSDDLSPENWSWKNRDYYLIETLTRMVMKGSLVFALAN
jgi:hypothetical protein